MLDTKKSGSFNFIPRLPKDLLSLFRRTTIEGIYQLYTGEELHMVKEFVNFIVDNKLGVFVQEISNYPSITNVYYSPSVVEIMVIDIVKKEHKVLVHSISITISQLSTSSVKIFLTSFLL